MAIAEELSYKRAVTVITGDPHDINLLVGLTRRANIAVDVASRRDHRPDGEGGIRTRDGV